MSHMYSKTRQKDKNFVIFEISILCPYLVNAIDIMKLLFNHALVKYNWLVIWELRVTTCNNKLLFVNLSYFFIHIAYSTNITKVILVCNPRV